MVKKHLYSNEIVRENKTKNVYLQLYKLFSHICIIKNDSSNTYIFMSNNVVQFNKNRANQ